MMNYGKMVIVGNTIEELEQDLEMLKVTLKSGKMCAVGGSSVAEVENGLAMMKQMMGAELGVTYHPEPKAPSRCNCDCGGVCEECECEDPEDLDEDFWEEEEDEEDFEEEELEEEELEPQKITGRMLVELLHQWEQEMK
jgi:hypothetical protein